MKLVIRIVVCVTLLPTLMLPNTSVKLAQADDPVSFANDVRPILAANCFGCHQGNIDRGDYVMTQFDSLVAGGESGDPAIVPGKPDESRLIELITSYEGEAEMPPDADPISVEDVEKIRSWVEAGAVNDYSKASLNYSPKNPPVYTRLPILSSIDFSPDGKLMAVSGFHEVLLLKTPDVASGKNSDAPYQGEVVHRLVGLSTRIESLEFSPDGKRLAVSGGNPGEFGEVQVWDVASGELELSQPVSFDTVYGVSWSPDGKMISFGCTDTTLRAIDSTSGDQVLFQGAHEDWIRDSVFSVDGSKLVSVGRDMSCKLTEVATQRFVDNITSITPGVLKGGIAAVVRHPTQDVVVIGGADGIPKVYRMERLTKRVIGDDANLIREFPAMPGRIQALAVSKDGKRIVAGSSLDGSGFVHVYTFEFDTSLPDNIKAINQKQVDAQTPAEKKALAEYIKQGVKQIASLGIEDSGIYSVAFHPSGKWLACGGSDGLIRIVETETGSLMGNLKSVPVVEDADQSEVAQWNFEPTPKSKPTKSNFDAIKSKIRSLAVSPAKIVFDRPTDYAQVVVQAVFEDGTRLDVTREAGVAGDANVVSVDGAFVQAVANGNSELVVKFKTAQAKIPVRVAMNAEAFVPDFVHDVNPVLSKLGCNAGTCHGSQGGKKGFKLSLRGYDPIYDVRSFTDDMGSRRTNLALPAASLMLLKPTGQVPHEGGKLFDKSDKYYALIHEWILGGAKLNQSSAGVVSVELFPKNPVLMDQGWQQQMRLVATYADGTSRDVTRESVIEAGNLEVAGVEGSLVTAKRRGESPLIGRYQGAFTATTLTVMGNREGFVWEDVETWGEIDRLVSGKWKRMKIKPSGLCSDAEFIRRVYLDLTGLPPAPDQVNAFLQDDRDARNKRDELVDQLIGNDEYVQHWSNKWADMLQVNRKYLGAEGARSLRGWIQGQVKTNRPYNEFAADILTASGSNMENPPAAYYKIHRTPEEVMENTTHLFLGTRFNCNKCHDHPFERWTQDQYYQTAAFFAQVDRKKDPKSGNKKIGGSAVEGQKPLYEIIADAGKGEVKHDRTGEIANPEFPFDCEFDEPENKSRRARLASWITSPDNPYFATSYANRLWGYLTGVGLIEPLDDIRAGNPPSNPQLMEYLRSQFVESGFDTQHMIKLICKSRTYQLSVATNQFNEDDTLNYSHAIARRLPAEVLFDSVHAVTGSVLKIPGVKPGTRAAELPDSGVKLPSGFLTTLGRPARESSCECERANDLQLGGVLALVSGPDVSRAINDRKNALATLVEKVPEDQELVSKIYLRILNRLATENEVKLSLETFEELASDHHELVKKRDARKSLVEKERPKLEKQRLAAIEEAKQQLSETIAKLNPDLEAKEAKRQVAVSAARKVLEAYKKESKGFDDWRTGQLTEVQWHPIMINKFESKVGKSFTIQADRSVLLYPKPGKDLYTVLTKTDLTGVSAVRLEMLPHDSLPNKGPGLADNGNLVLNEFEIEVAHPDRPDAWEKIGISSARANYSQNGFDIKETFSGNPAPRKGWALGGAAGKTSWATYQLKLPFGYSNGTLIRFKLHQTFADEKHHVGRFRISLSKHHEPVGLSLPEQFLAELAKPQKDWSDEQKKRYQKLFENDDPQLVKLKQALAEAEKPLEVNPQIIKLREKLARVSQPVPPDVTLVQLEKDVAMSAGQLENKRLTAAQDLAWALINSPSFLFNR